MVKNPIGTTFKKENIFLATVDVPMELDEVKAILKNGGDDLSTITENLLALITQEFDIFYKDEKGYTRFFMEGNETFAGDNSDGKGKLYNIVSAWDYYREDELCEIENEQGEPVIACVEVEENENNPLYRYNRDHNLK